MTGPNPEITPNPSGPPQGRSAARPPDWAAIIRTLFDAAQRAATATREEFEPRA